MFTKTSGFYHESIPAGVGMFEGLGEANGFQVMSTNDASVFTEKNLKQYKAVVFLNTTEDVLDSYQQAEFERYIQAGGGFLGIHGATDTEYNWDWFGRLVGARFNGHPDGTPTASIKVIDKDHSSTQHLPANWERTDEWYNFREINPDITVLATLDESSYEGGTNGVNHPIAWYHEYDGGRAFYTAGGHTDASFREELFVQHVWGGLSWVMSGDELDYSLATTQSIPEENRFTIEVLDWNLFEPMELEVLEDHRVLFIERHGAVKLYSPATDSTRVIASFDVHTKNEDGLLGLALDPNFKENNWVYLYYSPTGQEAKQHLSRFKFVNGQLDKSSEQLIMVIPTQREECCHQGGSIEFGPNGNLFLSLGDDTNPFESEGFAPIDERPGRKPFDAQRTSGNPNDLRGAILRIKMNEDGSYDIPEGNLFPEGTEGTRPEIYIMGNRNPFRISIDPKRGTLYWGEVGPDSGIDGVGFGPKGYDEVNQAKSAGFYGWPYFIGDNKPYWKYDFSQSQSLNQFDPGKPINSSPNNSGISELPAAQPAFIWYPYEASEEFPLVGEGGRNAMAGPIYYTDLYEDSDVKFPQYFDSKLFIYDWMRGWVHIITLDDQEQYVNMTPFMPSRTFSNPMDMQFARDGSLYMLEYGTTWYRRNEDARLLRITYNGGNRPPVVAASTNVEAGSIPLTVDFSSRGSLDYDDDEIRYLWNFDGRATSDEANPTFVYDEPGVYYPELTVTDEAGNNESRQLKVIAGNTPPVIEIEIANNRQFYWDKGEVLYNITVRDKEDGKLGEGIDPSSVVVTKHYLEAGFDETEITAGHIAPSQFITGKQLIDGSDCMACHKVDVRSIGPSYMEVATRYGDENDALSYLSEKILKGGGGVWGDQAMAAHPQLSKDQAEEMVKYILSLGKEDQDRLPISGSFVTEEHLDDLEKGRYYLKVTYTDRGNGDVPQITTSTTHEWTYFEHPLEEVLIEEEGEIAFDEIEGIEALEDNEDFEDFDVDVLGRFEVVGGGSVISLGEFDLSGVKSIAVDGYLLGFACSIEVIIGDEAVDVGSFKHKGSSGQLPAGLEASMTIHLQEEFDMEELGLIVRNLDNSKQSAAVLTKLTFDNR